METARTFTNRLADLLSRERAALGDFLVALADFDGRNFGLSKREAQALVAELQPMENPPLRAVVTPIRAPASATLPSTTALVSPRLDLAQEFIQMNRPERAEPVEPLTLAAAPSSAPATIQPLTAELSRYHVTVSRRFLEKLEAAAAALSHSRPGAGPEEIL